MTSEEAKRILNKGYRLLLLGFLVGLLVCYSQDKFAIQIILLLGYAFWATYWGYTFVKTKWSFSMDSPYHLVARSKLEYLWKSVFYNWTIFFFKMVLSYFIGAFGYGIYKQVILSRIAYI